MISINTLRSTTTTHFIKSTHFKTYAIRSSSSISNHNKPKPDVYFVRFLLIKNHFNRNELIFFSLWFLFQHHTYNPPTKPKKKTNDDELQKVSADGKPLGRIEFKVRTVSTILSLFNLSFTFVYSSNQTQSNSTLSLHNKNHNHNHHKQNTNILCFLLLPFLFL